MNTISRRVLRRVGACAVAAAVAVGSLSLAAPTSAESQAGSYKVTIKVSATTAIAKEDTLTFRGKVTPKAAGSTVALEQRLPNKAVWKTSGKAKIKKNGTYVLRDKPTRTGVRQYRVVKGASAGLRRGVSPAVKVTVYAWEALGYRTQGAAQNVASTEAIIAAQSYYPSLVTELTSPYPMPPVLQPTGFIEYTLAKKCTTLKATYSLDDKSATGSTGSIAISTDGAARDLVNLTVGSIFADRELDVTGAFRIRFDFTQSVNPAAYPAVGLPMVLCTR
jgi:hypothetical protein